MRTITVNLIGDGWKYYSRKSWGTPKAIGNKNKKLLAVRMNTRGDVEILYQGEQWRPHLMADRAREAIRQRKNNKLTGESLDEIPPIFNENH